ncbi:MAG: 2-oxoacid:acceptor oxidoreductase subunit alpha [Chloroflexi bacterium]|nr:2-oxoacid:acceptor oxidoreductase subunit alpha [Chloroflexota bacterium]
MVKQREELAWRVGGPQGSGVDTAAGIFQRACAIGGLHVYGRREYYSNIKGRHSYYDVRVAHHPVTSHRESVDLLTTFEAESLVRHAMAVVPGGAIIYNTKSENTPLDRMIFLDPRLREDLKAFLEAHGLPLTSAGLLEDARKRGVQTYGVPYDEITKALAERLSIPKGIADRTLNTIAVAISAALLDFPAEYVIRGLKKIFKGKEKVIDLNIEAVNLAYDYVHTNFDTEDFEFRMDVSKEPVKRLLLNGNQAVALGKLAGGLTMQTYYPISPATDESVFLEAHSTFPLRNGEMGSVVVVQTEDELSAIGMAAGAALTGARVATATSGPGLSLMTEALGWAGINEVPVVVTNYMRGGPSTGMPTRTDQADLLFAVHGGHGEFPRIVLASGDVEEAFYDAARSLNYAERYQMPVIHLVDKALSSATATVDIFDLSNVRIDRGILAEPVEDANGTPPFPRFRMTESGISPRPFHGQPGHTHWLTGAEHTEIGRVTEDPVTREGMMEKRMRKLETACAEIPEEEKFRVYGDPDAPFTIIGWGSTKGAVLDAMERLAKEGIPTRFLHIRMLWPFPAKPLKPYLDSAEPLVLAELTYSGHLDRLLRETACRPVDYQVLKYSGRPFSGEALYDAFKKILSGEAEPRIIVRNPME